MCKRVPRFLSVFRVVCATRVIRDTFFDDLYPQSKQGKKDRSGILGGRRFRILRPDKGHGRPGERRLDSEGYPVTEQHPGGRGPTLPSELYHRYLRPIRVSLFRLDILHVGCVFNTACAMNEAWDF